MIFGKKEPREIKDNVVETITAGKAKKLPHTDLTTAFTYLSNLSEFLNRDIGRLGTTLTTMKKGTAGYRQTSLELDIKKTQLTKCESELLVVRKEYELRMGRVETHTADKEAEVLKKVSAEKAEQASKLEQAMDASADAAETEKEAEQEKAKARAKRQKID